MISFISSFKTTNVTVPESKLLFQISVSVTVAVNRNGISTPLANGVSTFFNKSKSSFLLMDQKYYQETHLTE